MRTELYRLMPVVLFVCLLLVLLLLFVIVCLVGWLVGSLFCVVCLFVLFCLFFRGLLRCRNIRSEERIVGR